jgi:D-glycero-D-manno-heptose 1,7-bisphosphate phosphatase
MARTPLNQAVFFELDGVLVSQARLTAEGQVPYFPGALQALGRLDPRRFQLFVASNREDIALGRMRDRDFKRFCERMLDDFRAEGIRITRIYHCPFHPKGRGKWKKDSVFLKPAPGMFKMAQQEFDLHLGRSWVIGHTTVDILGGSRAGMGTVLVRTGAGGNDAAFVVDPHFIEDDLRSAVARIASFEHALTC